MLRSGPFSDECVVGLLNSRFVPFYFDLGRRSPAADDQAKAFVVAVMKELGGSSVPTPPVLLMTPEGKLLGKISNYATEAVMLKGLRAVLVEHPQYALPAELEAELPRLERARIAHWIGEDKRAAALLEGERSPAESLFLVRLARRSGDLKQAEEILAEIDSESDAAEIALERALLAHLEGHYDAMSTPLAAYPSDGPRAPEAQYYLGLSQFHLGQPKLARETWKALVASYGETRWSYRADWAYCQTNDKGLAGRQRSFTTAGGGSLLGRHGYMGRQNPDLERHPR